MVSEKCPLSLQILRSEGTCPPRVTGHTARLEPRVHPRPGSLLSPLSSHQGDLPRPGRTDTPLSLLHAERSSFAGGSPCARLRREGGEQPSRAHWAGGSGTAH